MTIERYLYHEKSKMTLTAEFFETLILANLEEDTRWRKLSLQVWVLLTGYPDSEEIAARIGKEFVDSEEREELFELWTQTVKEFWSSLGDSAPIVKSVNNFVI